MSIEKKTSDNQKSSSDNIKQSIEPLKTNNEPNQTNEGTCIVKKKDFSYLNPFSWFGSNENAVEEVERKMFSNIKTPVKRFYVNIRNQSLKIWTFSANTESENTPIVLIHGYCGGLGIWLHNLDELAANRPVYAIDLLGFGRSSRPPFSNDPIVAETQFVESIEDWRKEMNLKEMILLGHSFGGYIVCSYALKYPDYVKSLLLADPWGFSEYSEEEKPDTPIPLWINLIVKSSQYVSPMAVFRWSGQLGVQIFKQLRPDFRKKFMTIMDDPELIYSYLYYVNNLNPTGEAGFKAVSRYFGFAKNPMIRRIDKIKSHIPIGFIYGSRSWIDCAAGYSAVYLRQSCYQGAQVSVEIITGAGHHVYADRPKEFNEHVKYLLEEIEYESESASESTSPSFD